MPDSIEKVPGTSASVRTDDDGGSNTLCGTPYRFIAAIGSGAMGDLVEAEHIDLGYRVAVKLLPAHHFARFDRKDRMRLEAETCTQIRHPNLTLVTDFGETADGRTFIVMERLHGHTMRAELNARGALPPSEAIDLVSQALAGLSAAHEAGVVHRDVTPDNLFLCPLPAGGRRVKVLDFGIAKIVDAGRDPRTPAPLAVPTTTNMTLGTPRYFSPEQARAERDVDARTDVYATGWVLHALLVGHDPYPHCKTLLALTQAHTTEIPPLPSLTAPHSLPAGLDAVVMKAMAKRREDRFMSAAAFRTALLGISDGLAR